MQLFQALYNYYFSIYVLSYYRDSWLTTASLTASEAIRRLVEVKQFAEVHGDNDLNMALNDLIGRFEALKLQKLKQSDIQDFFKSS